jgi:hypothetical protein
VRLGGASPPPFPLSTITSKVVVCAPAERADTLLLFLLYPYMYCTLWCCPYSLSHFMPPMVLCTPPMPIVDHAQCPCLLSQRLSPWKQPFGLCWFFDLPATSTVQCTLYTVQSNQFCVIFFAYQFNIMIVTLFILPEICITVCLLCLYCILHKFLEMLWMPKTKILWFF